MPPESIARTTLEVVALLLTLLFFAVQYGTRHLESDRVPNELLSGAMETVVHASLYLNLAALVAVVVIYDTTESGIVFLMALLLYIGLLVIALSIRNTASALRDYSDPDQPTARLNLDQDQTSLEDFDE